LVRELVDAIKNLVIGLFTSAKHIPRKRVTLVYPTERWPMPERSRGIVVLLSDKETGELNCTTCLLCQRACPTAAIKIDYEKDEKNKRHLKDFQIDFTVCCFCGLCEESCNFAAIKMAPKYEFSTLNKEDLIWHTDKLQEMGRDVPYELPARKKRAAAKKPAPKPAEKPAAESAKSEPEIKEEKPAAQPEPKSTEDVDSNPPEDKKEDIKPADSAPEKIEAEPKNESPEKPEESN